MKLSLFKQQFLERLTPLYGAGEALSFFRLLCEHFLKMTTIEIHLHPEKELVNAELAQFTNAQIELEIFRPIQYILGGADFCQLWVKVRPGVLIPRPETEEMCHLAIREIQSRWGRAVPVTILDICTGSGCIALALKSGYLDAVVTATDVSEMAIDVAMKNSAELQLPIQLVMTDFLDKNSWEKFGMFNVIISNPPYVTQREKASLPANVQRYEPELALVVPDHDPLVFYRNILEFAKTHLHPEGFVFTEFNEQYSEEILFLARSFGFLDCMVLNDFRDKPRFLKVVYQG